MNLWVYADSEVPDQPSLSAKRIIRHDRMHQWRANVRLRLCACAVLIWICAFCTCSKTPFRLARPIYALQQYKRWAFSSLWWKLADDKSLTFFLSFPQIITDISFKLYTYFSTGNGDANSFGQVEWNARSFSGENISKCHKLTFKFSRFYQILYVQTC